MTERRSRGKAASPASTVATRATSNASSEFPIVGIGTSAGGLEALQEFFQNVPPASGLAFVVVQHLDPTHKGLLVELLQRVTAMPVAQARERMRVEPDHVYVIPPSRDLHIRNGVLHLVEPQALRGLRLPIDAFLRSLADDRPNMAIGVVLSGMGSDGTLGLGAIKENAGAAFVQAPESAKFDSMPRSAIDAGLADIVAPAGDLPGKIIDYLQHVPNLEFQPAAVAKAADVSGLGKVLLLVRAQTGHDFGLYKKSTMYRRIERRMGLHQIPRIADYARYLGQNPAEIDLLFKELLIGVTSFFRDPAAWEQLKNEVVPGLLAANPDGGTLRAWTAACSTGEEAYSLAIVFQEVLAQARPPRRYSLQIFATDLNGEAIAKARTGLYLPNIATDVSEERRRRFFVEERGGYRVGKEIRDMVIFAPQNLILDPPFTRLDLITCRNLLIYFEPELQKKVLTMFHYSLRPGGILMLGSAETTGQATQLFSQLSGRERFYRRMDFVSGREVTDFPAAFSTTTTKAGAVAAQAPGPLPGLNLKALTDAALLLRFSPPAVLTTEAGEILYVSGKTGKFLEAAAGKANLNVFAMAREGLAVTLSEAFARALRLREIVTIPDVKVSSDGGATNVKLTVEPLSDKSGLAGMVLVSFYEVTTPGSSRPPPRRKKGAATGDRTDVLVQELQQAREDLQSTREEMQASQEELKATNEELQSTNEELQSTNEELTTSKEEMQSMNEELHTVNQELTTKLDELSQTGDDLRNLLNSTEIATLYLDGELKVRRFTSETASLIKLIPGDVGRPITDLANTLNYPGLADDAQEVLRTLVFHESEAVATGGRWFRTRIMPYRRQDNRIDGVVITFIDVSAGKRVESELLETVASLRRRVADLTARLSSAAAAPAGPDGAGEIHDVRNEVPPGDGGPHGN